MKMASRSCARSRPRSHELPDYSHEEDECLRERAVQEEKELESGKQNEESKNILNDENRKKRTDGKAQTRAKKTKAVRLTERN